MSTDHHRPAPPDRIHSEEIVDEAGVRLSGLAHKSIVDLIASQTIEGTITEAKLATMLGISRTPLREALQRLKGEGLINKAPGGRSFSVRKPNSGDLRHSLHVREILEPSAAESAALAAPRDGVLALRAEIESLWNEQASRDTIWRLDQAVRDLLVAHCGNSALSDILRSQHLIGRLARGRLERRRQAEALAGSKEEFLALLDALAARQPKRAFKAMRTHLRRLRRACES